jgi:hypothetical protein
MENGLTAAVFLLVLIIVTVCAYLMAWRGKRLWARKLGAAVVACISFWIGLGALFSYAIPPP